MSTSSPQQRAADQTPVPNLHRRKRPDYYWATSGRYSLGRRAGALLGTLLVVLGVVFRGLVLVMGRV